MTSNPDSTMGRVIRAAFEKSGMSIKALSIQADVSYASAHGFVQATRDPTISTASRMCEVLGLELRPVGRGKVKR